MKCLDVQNGAIAYIPKFKNQESITSANDLLTNISETSQTSRVQESCTPACLFLESGFLEQLDKVSHRNFIHMKARAPELAICRMENSDMEKQTIEGGQINGHC